MANVRDSATESSPDESLGPAAPQSVSGSSDDTVSTAALLRAVLDVALARVEAPLVLAISGGRDSMALMHAVARWAPQRLATIATYDHATGQYAKEASALVAAEARRLGLTVVRERARVQLHTEAEWRDARWRFLQRVAKAYNARVATAHTRDDQVETIAMRLLRGTGTRGLAALAATSPVVRPWLSVAREEVAAWAALEKIPYLDDPMNASRQYQRGRVRHDILPAIQAVQPDFAGHMLALGERAAEWRRELDDFLDHTNFVTTETGALRIPTSVFANTTDDGRAILWPGYFARIGVALDARGTSELVRFSRTGRLGAWVSVAGGAKALHHRDDQTEFFEIRAPDRSNTPLEFVWSGEADQVPRRLGRWRFRRMTPGDARMRADNPWVFGIPVDATITVRDWQSGDRITSTGVPAGRRVARYFSEAHIPALDRSGWPVVLMEGTLLCVPGLCRSNAAPQRPGWPDSIWYCCEHERT
jgi:tRNA(Ile)-lysidine synthase